MIHKLNVNKNYLKIVGVVILLLAFPLTLILIKQTQDQRSSAAAADKLEVEGGTLSSTGVTKQSDSNASGGQYVELSQPIRPTPTSSPSTTGRGPRLAPAVPTGNNVYIIPSSIPNNGTGDTGPTISAWLKSLPQGSIAVFTSSNTQGYKHAANLPNATYRLSSNGIEVPPGITLWGYGTKIKLETPGTQFSHAAFSMFPQGRMDIRGFEVQGVNQNAGTTTAHDVDRQHGIAMAIAGGSNSNISAHIVDMWVHHTWSDAFYVAGWEILILPRPASNLHTTCSK